MKASLRSFRWSGLAVAALLAGQPVNAQTPPADQRAANKSEPIPLDQLGAAAGKQYQGDGLSVTATPEGARLRCVFQRLEGQVTPEGLWLESTAPGAAGKLRLIAAAVDREVLECGSPRSSLPKNISARHPSPAPASSDY